ncbi:MAG: Rpn family recombination-promoting nuclease/putative transposase [Oscillospiraceae bacterium]|nr:Rpn family recombination-promoting nuclease/putative transposase [Candidatus Limimonas egerieequi]
MDKKSRAQAIKDFTIFDDAYMQAFFNNDIPNTELVLRIILDKPDLKVETVGIQQRLINSQGHDGVVDVLATDKIGKIYNIEIQNDMREATPRRARYYSSLLDTNHLEEGEDYSKLPETYIIFITKGDYFKLDEPIHNIEMAIKKHLDIDVNYGVHLIYVNGNYRGDDPLGLLMKDFSCKNPADMYYNSIREKTDKLKADGGVLMHGPVMDKLILQENTEMLIRLYKKGKITKEAIAEELKISLDDVEKLLSK